MKIALLLLYTLVPVQAKTAAEAMQEAIAKQRATVRKQVPSTSTDAFFTVPWTSNAQPTVAPIASMPAKADCPVLAEGELSGLIKESAIQNSVDPILVKAIIGRESAGKPCAISSKGAQGLMQLMPAAQSDLGVSDAFDPRQNIAAGTLYLKQMLTRYGGDIKLALAAYNAGPNRVEPGGTIPEIPETQAYVSGIYSAYEAAKGIDSQAK